MTDSEKIDRILLEIQGMKTEIRDMKTDIQVLKTEMQGVKTDTQVLKTEMQGVKTEIQNIKLDIRNTNGRIDNLEKQVKQTECALKEEIRKECNLVLNEVERVHILFEKHRNDKSVHTA